jgi:hypothetical protein
MRDRSSGLGPWGAVLGAIRKALATTTTTTTPMAAAMAAAWVAWARLMAIKRCLMATDDL